MEVDIYGMPVEAPFSRWRVDAVDCNGQPVNFWVVAKTQIQAAKSAERVISSVSPSGILAVTKDGEL